MNQDAPGLRGNFYFNSILEIFVPFVLVATILLNLSSGFCKMSANDFDCAGQWPTLDFQDPEANALISHALSYEQLAQQSCDPNQSLLLLQNEQDAWIMSGQYWNGENFQAAEMPKNPNQWQLWNEAGLINTANEEADLNMG